jgi:hypothetical protein
LRIFSGKGSKHRAVTLANKLTLALHWQITKVKQYLALDMQDDRFAGVSMRQALRVKYQHANESINCQYLFPAAKSRLDPETICYRRHHINDKKFSVTSN